MKAQQRIGYLDGLRGVAILAVLGVHWLHPYTDLAPGGYIGVDVFFVLSGYIITTIIWRRRDAFSYVDFLRNRARRLYPALLGVVLVAGPLAVLAGVVPLQQGLVNSATALAQLNAFVAGLDLFDPTPFGITWSLSAEWVFYVLWPLLLTRMPASARRTALIAAALALGLYLVSLPTSPEWFYFGPTSRAAQLLAGSALALMLLAKPARSPAPRAAIAAAVVLTTASLAWVLAGPGELSVLYRLAGFPLATATGLTLIAAGHLAPASRITQWMSWRPLSALGVGSYSVYLWHTIPPALLDKDVIPVPVPVLAVLGVVAAVSLSVLSYRFLERPHMRARNLGASSNRTGAVDVIRRGDRRRRS